jgi:hypothetical protein
MLCEGKASCAKAERVRAAVAERPAPMMKLRLSIVLLLKPILIVAADPRNAAANATCFTRACASPTFSGSRP